MSTTDRRPSPQPDEISSFYWQGAAAGQLLVQRCDSCSRFQYPPDVGCIYCQSLDLTPVEVSGRGRLWSYTVVERVFHAGFSEVVPYVVALVELDAHEGLRLLTNIVDCDPAGLEVDMAVEVCFEDRGDAVVPQFRPVTTG